MQKYQRSHASVQLHFAHANGFPAGSYERVFSALPAHFSVLSKAKFAHEGKMKIDKNWHTLVSELISYCEANANPHIPLWAVGHSMGGIISFKACCLRPDLFAGLIMLDPPLITGAFTPLLKLAKRTPLIDKITPAAMSSSRKSSWLHSEDMLKYFKSKTLFKGMRDECIQDYINSATQIRGSNRRLSFDAEIEAQLFRHVPDDLNRFRMPVSCTGVIITGQGSNVCRPIMYKRFARKHNLSLSTIPGGHMFPMEHPSLTASAIAGIINEA